MLLSNRCKVPWILIGRWFPGGVYCACCDLGSLATSVLRSSARVVSASSWGDTEACQDRQQPSYTPSIGFQDTSAYQLSVLSYCPNFTVTLDASCFSGADPENATGNKYLRTATLLTCIGSDTQDVYEGLEFVDEADKDIDVVLQKLRYYCIGETNEIYERYRFNKRDQEPNESLDAYVTTLRMLAKTCNFAVLVNSLIRERIVIGVSDYQARKKLLQVSKLALKECIDICRSYEIASQQLKEIHEEEVSTISQANEKTPPSPVGEREIRRKFWAKTHVWNKLKCPAWGKTCSKCGIQNHFAVACKTKLSPPTLATSSKRPTPRHVRGPVHAVEDSDLDEYVTCVNVKKQVCAM
ncbi:hypothetical protein AWC38_SpisGene3496 [Stylophora pistillata]|uniref:CCHC-type domain-containing protein n=1 Tax=Stylophora pistillata TaxID=50429 RepID=A0A2B4SRB5_STYPI|nr:hypothetical protein AWC38_SpisGene3496 [Stylophora pistillata]